jgi:hypothetical protein
MLAPGQPGSPSITQVTGVIAPGQLVTLIGSNMHAEQRLNWDPFWASHPTRWSFEGRAPFGPDSDGYSQPGGDPGGVYDTTVRILGDQSIRFRSRSSGRCTGPGIAPSSLYAAPSLQQEYWVRVYVRWHRLTNWPTNYAKMLYALGAGYYLQPQGARAGEMPSGMNATHDGTSNDVNTGKLVDGRWYAVEVHWRAATPRIYEVFWDGRQVYRAKPGTAGKGDLGALLIGIINACGSEPWDIEHWMDGLAVAGQRIYPSAVVEVGNTSNYAGARRVVQPLEFISDTRVQFRLDVAGLGRGPYYVWVRNNAQLLSNAMTLRREAADR